MHGSLLLRWLLSGYGVLNCAKFHMLTTILSLSGSTVPDLEQVGTGYESGNE